MAGDDVLLEYQRFGAIVRVRALDPATLTEVTIQAPANTPQPVLARTATAKLRYVLAKNAGGAP